MAKEENSCKIPLSVVIIAKNEEANIEECLRSVAFAEEIIVVDDFSDDNTEEIAKRLGAKVYQRKLDGWGPQQTFAITQATQPWLLLLDCDERITPKLAQEIRERVSHNEKFAYEIKRINHFKRLRVNHGVLRPDYVPRLIPRAGTSVEGLVHPKIVYPYPTKKLRAPMLHFTYESWTAYLVKLEKYTRLAAQKKYDQGKRAHFFLDIILRPAFAFFKIHFLNLGFLDGRIGLCLSIGHYYYTAMKGIRLYYLQKNAENNH
ncbi:MAG: glycosyltransferase family 2 protein [Opitutae bacterium]|nr:glycosyltransferase family 2 protein [Opitutae bacterium]